MRIWFNHWFSTAYHLITLMREGAGRELTVIGSNSNPQAVYRQICQEWYPEEDLPPREYVDFCLDFCRRHEIQVFVPRRQLAAIAGARAQFEALGVRLFAEKDAALTTLLDDKEATYAYFEREMPELLPAYRVARSLEDFRRALEELRPAARRLCYKLTVDEGARSFRVIDDGIESISALYAKPGSKITRAAAEKVLSSYDFSVPLLVMPYLGGADVSVDCLSTRQGPLMLPRFKVGRYHEVRLDEDVMALCRGIMGRMPFDMPVNIQFKMEGDRPYLLEINPRMSGGLQQACLATGINLPALALKKLLGEDFSWQYPRDRRAVGMMNLETPVVVTDGGVLQNT